MKANVFLVDYGSIIETDVKKKVRKLQLKNQAAEPAQAFRIILEGLYPVSMVNHRVVTLYFLIKMLQDIDWESGDGMMQQYRLAELEVFIIRSFL